MVAVHDEVRLLHGVARKKVRADALLGRELLQVVQVVDSRWERDLFGEVQDRIALGLIYIQKFS